VLAATTEERALFEDTSESLFIGSYLGLSEFASGLMLSFSYAPAAGAFLTPTAYLLFNNSDYTNGTLTDADLCEVD
jgi:hypothetical protein